MFSALPALLALKLGTSVAQQGGPVLRLEQQSLLAASAGPQALVMRFAAPGNAHALEQHARPAGAEPFLRPYAPDEWVTAVARGLNLSEGRVLDAARFVATMPVQVDVRARHVFVRIRVRNF